MRLSRGFLVALVTALVSSCGEAPREPRPINPAADVCAVCRMTVVPEGHAAEALGEDGTVLVFDDPGCLALDWHDNPARYEGSLAYVQDAETKAWVAWEKATFVRADEVASPMAYGWHAFAEAQAAEAFAAGHPGETTRVLPAGLTLPLLANDLQDRRWAP